MKQLLIFLVLLVPFGAHSDARSYTHDHSVRGSSGGTLVSGKFSRGHYRANSRNRSNKFRYTGGQFQAREKQPEVIQASVREAPPYSYKDPETGEWMGIAVDLARMVFTELGYEYELNDAGALHKGLEDVTKGTFDIGIGPYSATPSRKALMDLSHPYEAVSLAFASKSNGSWTATVIWYLNKIAEPVAVFIVALYIVGFMASRIDPNDDIKTIHDGAWWALVTLSTVGYGDLVHKTGAGRLFASTWITLSLLFLSSFTGYMASAFTVKKLSDNPPSFSEMYERKVGSVKGSRPSRFLDDLGIKYNAYEDLQDLTEALRNDEVSVVLYDEPLLKHRFKDDENIRIWPIPTQQVDLYVYIFPQGGDLEEEFSRVLMKVQNSKDWMSTRNAYFN